jgi:hypothetical protein
MPFQIPRGGNTRFAFSYMQSLQGSTFISSAGGFSPNTLFTSGEAGDWFDPSDLSRMFTNTTGTTPVTADGQTVALMLGQRRGANVELISDNIDAQFDNKQTGWTATATTISYNGPGFNQITDTVLLTIGRVYEVKGTVSDWAGSGTLQVNVGVTNNVATGNGTFTFLITASSASFSFRTTAALSFTISNISVKEVALTALTQSDAAKRPAYKTSGGLHWLQFDGTNDALASAATLNLTGTDEVTTCIGAFRDNVGNRVFFEFSPSVDTNNGSFFLQNSPGFDTTKVRFRTKGTLAASVEPVVGTQPKTSLFTTTAKVSTDTAIVREDGAQIGSSASDQGTGNMGNHTLYVASSGPGALFLNGNIYFLLVRGALTAGADLTALEGFAAAKTGVTI